MKSSDEQTLLVSSTPTSTHMIRMTNLPPPKASGMTSTMANEQKEAPGSHDKAARGRDAKKAFRERTASRKQPTRASKMAVKKRSAKPPPRKDTSKKTTKEVKKKEFSPSELQQPTASSLKEVPGNLDAVSVTHSTLPESTTNTLNSIPETDPQIHSNNIMVSEKKKRVPARYQLNPGLTPFPNWKHPTPDECEEVNELLSYEHGKSIAPETIPKASIEFAGCGEVPCILDALIRTMLSAATQGSNAALSYNGLAKRFGILEEGVGKGGVNWEAVRQAPLRDVFETIKRGGLADTKSKNLKAILDMVYEENQARYATLKPQVDTSSTSASTSTCIASGNSDDSLIADTLKKESEYEITCVEQNFLSLNHLHNFSTEEAMAEMMRFPGIGVKTAACVLLFCMRRPCFAVDTHIFRICKWLGWVPASGANEVAAFSHLNTRIPDHLKYSLHNLLIKHGKMCPRCRAMTGENSELWELGCPIDHLVTRTGKRKGGSVSGPRGGKRKKVVVSKVASKRRVKKS